MSTEEIQQYRETIRTAKCKLRIAIEILEKAERMSDEALDEVCSPIIQIERDMEGPDEGVLYQILCELDYEMYKYRNK